uniref:Uncharacterized protein n=1 Tax=Oryza punctata TaxID=4537 RepID=A0A0E0JZE8_ORYPU
MILSAEAKQSRRSRLSMSNICTWSRNPTQVLNPHSSRRSWRKKKFHPPDIPFHFEEYLFNDYENTSNYSYEKRPPTRVSDRPLEPTAKTFRISTNSTTKGLGIISGVPTWHNSVEAILDFHVFEIFYLDILIGHPIEKLLDVPETGVLNRKIGRIATFVPEMQSTNSLIEPIPIPEPIEEVLAISPFEPLESTLDESIEEFNQGDDEYGETIDLPKTDQPS